MINFRSIFFSITDSETKKAASTLKKKNINRKPR